MRFRNFPDCHTSTTKNPGATAIVLPQLHPPPWQLYPLTYQGPLHLQLCPPSSSAHDCRNAPPPKRAAHPMASHTASKRSDLGLCHRPRKLLLPNGK
ncbi:unnamed protein product [Zymoseptoria tritici ST99CH_1E4]|uniref:Uncharacterized protein n=1 Tax=Zymoseptoria tritici ST99CH_1E4 TaxID=1276532 RepID=A0A2H1H8T2_ZYMTR|nr:unnamed protein product [Zymoseptoria tritici ST99CH_1E4]